MRVVRSDLVDLQTLYLLRDQGEDLLVCSSEMPPILLGMLLEGEARMAEVW